jgi:hypothetical protein
MIDDTPGAGVLNPVSPSPAETNPSRQSLAGTASVTPQAPPTAHTLEQPDAQAPSETESDNSTVARSLDPSSTSPPAVKVAAGTHDARRSFKTPIPQATFPPYLPERFDGQRIHTLSVSQLETLLSCPERYRRERIRGERDSPSGESHLGSCFDRAVELYMHNKIHGRQFSADDACEAYMLEWETLERRANELCRPIRFGEPTDNADFNTLFHAGIKGLQAYLAPNGLGNSFQPISVQRRLEMKVLPNAYEAKIPVTRDQSGRPTAWETVRLMDRVFWAVVFVLDIVAIDARDETVVIDNKIKRSWVKDPAHQLQPDAYLAALAREDKHAIGRFEYHTVHYAEREVEVRAQPTTRTPEQLNAFWLRVAQAARRLDYYSRTYQPEEPWDLAAPGHYALCNDRDCPFFEVCPGGHGM